MEDLCVSKYAAVPHLSVFNFNTRALLMYIRLGFEPYAVEERKNLQGQAVALIHMRRPDDIAPLEPCDFISGA